MRAHEIGSESTGREQEHPETGSAKAERGSRPARGALSDGWQDGATAGQAISHRSDAAAARSLVELSIAPERVLSWLLAVIAMLLLAATLGAIAHLEFERSTIWGLRQLFHVGHENNVPTYFSSVQLLAAAILLGLIACREAQIRSPWRWHFGVLAVGFVALSVDEMASIHELLARLGLFLMGDFFYFTWLAPALVIVALVALSYIGLLRALPRQFQVLFATSGAVFVAGAVGVESIGSEIARDQLDTEASWAYQLVMIVEEGLEMAGIALFIYALLLYIARARISLVARVAS